MFWLVKDDKIPTMVEDQDSTAVLFGGWWCVLVKDVTLLSKAMCAIFEHLQCFKPLVEFTFITTHVMLICVPG